SARLFAVEHLDENGMTERGRADALGVSTENDKADEIVGPGIEMPAVGKVAALHEEIEDVLDGVEPADRLTVADEVVFNHAAADIHDHLDGDAFGGDARFQV